MRDAVESVENLIYTLRVRIMRQWSTRFLCLRSAGSTAAPAFGVSRRYAGHDVQPIANDVWKENIDESPVLIVVDCAPKKVERESRVIDAPNTQRTAKAISGPKRVAA